MPPKRRNRPEIVKPSAESEASGTMVENFDITAAKNKIAELENQLRLQAIEISTLRRNAEIQPPIVFNQSLNARRSIKDSTAKQKNNNSQKCSCAGSCLNKKCGCVKKNISCNEFCKCDDNCANKLNNEDEEDKENQEQNQNNNRETQQQDDNNSEVLEKTRKAAANKKKENNKESNDNNKELKKKNKESKEKNTESKQENRELKGKNKESAEKNTKSTQESRELRAKNKESKEKNTKSKQDNKESKEKNTESKEKNTESKRENKESKGKNKESKQESKEVKGKNKVSKEGRGKKIKPLSETKNEQKDNSSENKPTNNTDNTVSNEEIEKAKGDTVNNKKTPNNTNVPKQVRSLFDTPKTPILIAHDESSNSTDTRIPDSEDINPMQPRRQLPRTPPGSSKRKSEDNIEANISFYDTNAIFVSILKEEDEEDEDVSPPPEIFQAEVNWIEHQANLVVCHICNRKFYRHRIKKHERSCKKI